MELKGKKCEFKKVELRGKNGKYWKENGGVERENFGGKKGEIWKKNLVSFEVTAEKNGEKKVKKGEKKWKKVDLEGKIHWMWKVWGPWRGNFGVPVLGNGEKWCKKQKNGLETGKKG